jgi:type III restriction enzyme
LAQRLIDAVPEAEREAVREAVTAHRRRRRIPAARFEVPQLCLWVDGELELAERELFLSGWNLLDFPAELTEDDFAIRETSDSYLVDIQGQRLVARHLGAQMELDLNDVDTGWTELGLSRWLDGRLPQPDVRQEVNLEFMRRLVAGLVHRRHIAVPVLARARLALQNAVARRINMYRLQACRKGYQDMLFGPQAAVQTSYDYRFSFDPRGYPAHWTYDGTYQFKKHFYPLVGELDPKGDEFDCARAIDQCPQVACWVRNVPSQSNASFRLPTSTDYFYPDFVALLTDGRILVVEYKGGHLLGPDTEEKQNVGELWEEKSNGRALFLLALKEDARGRDVSKQLAYKLDPARRGLAGCSYLL